MSSESRLISIIVPSFQQGPFIRECIESILSQKGVPVEVIVFDSESSDETARVLDDFKHQVKIVVERDLGQAHAINKGLKICSGDIVGFLNSDDTLLPGCLEKVVNYWEANPAADLLYGKAKYINRNGEVTGEYRTKQWDFENFQGECFICQPAAFWSRRIMGKIGFLDQRLRCSLDYDYWLRIALAGGAVVHLDEYLACSRDYPETKTRNLRNRVFRENIRLSLNRLGYVHGYWIFQYMDYIKYERRFRWSYLIPSSGSWRNLIVRLVEKISRVWARDVDIKDKSFRRII